MPLCSVGVEGGWVSGWPVGWLPHRDASLVLKVLGLGVGGWAACCWWGSREAGRDLLAPGDGWLPARGACWCVAMRVGRLECWGGLRGRAGWDDGLEELEEASLTSLESLRASWLMPGLWEVLLHPHQRTLQDAGPLRGFRGNCRFKGAAP